MQQVKMTSLLGHNITRHDYLLQQLDFDPLSVGNIQQKFSKLEDVQAEAISMTSKRQYYRNLIKRDLLLYFRK